MFHKRIIPNVWRKSIAKTIPIVSRAAVSQSIQQPISLEFYTVTDTIWSDRFYIRVIPVSTSATATSSIQIPINCPAFTIQIHICRDVYEPLNFSHTIRHTNPAVKLLLASNERKANPFSFPNISISNWTQ